MWPVTTRSSCADFWSEANPPSRLDGCDVGLAKPYRNLDGEGDRIVREHEALKRFVAQLVIPDRRDDERGGLGSSVLPDVDDGMGGVGEGCLPPERRGLWSPLPR